MWLPELFDTAASLSDAAGVREYFDAEVSSNSSDVQALEANLCSERSKTEDSDFSW